MAQTDDDLRADDDGMALTDNLAENSARRESYDLGVKDGYKQALDDVEETIKRQRFMHSSGIRMNL